MTLPYIRKHTPVTEVIELYSNTSVAMAIICRGIENKLMWGLNYEVSEEEAIKQIAIENNLDIYYAIVNHHLIIEVCIKHVNH